MNALFTDKENERLAEMMEIVSWQFANNKSKSFGIDKLAHAFKGRHGSGNRLDVFEDAIALDNEIIKKDANFSISREVDDDTPVWDYNEQYEDKIFWSELKERIVARAAALSLENNDYLDLTHEEKAIFQTNQESSNDLDIGDPEPIFFL